MKTLLNYFLGVFTVMSLSNCANGKKLQQEAPVALQQAYYNVHLAQGDSNDSRVNLYLPTEKAGDTSVQLDSVYFRGKKAALLPAEEEQGLYVAYFENEGRNKDLVMHSDPREEYGNQVPILEKIPFELKSDEAILVFSRNGEKAYYKITGIVERRADGTQIKKPENIQH